MPFCDYMTIWLVTPSICHLVKTLVSIIFFVDSNWRQVEAKNSILAGAVELNALAQGALRLFTQWHVDRTTNLSVERRTLY